MKPGVLVDSASKSVSQKCLPATTAAVSRSILSGKACAPVWKPTSEYAIGRRGGDEGTVAAMARNLYAIAQATGTTGRLET